jgi:F-type H+-transporting ATPase subunit a
MNAARLSRIFLLVALLCLALPLFAGKALASEAAAEAEHAAAGGGDMGSYMMHHLGNSHHWKVTPFGPTLNLPSHWMVGNVDLSISLHVLLLLISFALLVIVLRPAAKRLALAPTGKLGHLVEVFVLFIRDEVVKPNLGEKDAVKWTPFFLTLFFFLLSLNLIGLIPGFPAATGNINFTAAMSLLIFVVFNVAGIQKNGLGHYFTNLVPKGLPIAVLPLIAVIEFLGLFTKTFALAIRLFANMTAGHVLIMSLLGLIIVFKTVLASAAFVPFTLFIYMIELLVAFLQAYVFTLLASLFVGSAIHQEH